MRSLQCARALAALLVVYFHASLAAGRLVGTDASGPIVTGKAGVDVFFVLSGYIIWTSTRRSSLSAAAFMRKRLFRIAPLYWLLTTLTAAIAMTMPWLLNSTRFAPEHYIASLLFLPWRNPAFTDASTDLMTPVIIPGWTLNFEMAFYLLFSVALFCDVRWRGAVVTAVFGAVMLVVSAFRGRSPIIDFYDPLLMLEFLFGVALGAAVERGFRIPLTVAVSLLAIGSVVLVWLDALGLPVHRVVSSGLPALVILASVISIEAAGRWPNLPWLVGLGDASFSLYLSHGFVLAGIRAPYHHMLGLLSGFVAAWIYILSAMVLSCGAGLLCYRFVELPLGRALDRATRGSTERNRLRSGSRQDVPARMADDALAVGSPPARQGIG